MSSENPQEKFKQLCGEIKNQTDYYTFLEKLGDFDVNFKVYFFNTMFFYKFY